MQTSADNKDVQPWQIVWRPLQGGCGPNYCNI
ncbi:hypothetical protein F3H83_21275 [Aeromonas hydrophila]|nr:hypothetical protein [Aeromonas hydrophila]